MAGYHALPVRVAQELLPIPCQLLVFPPDKSVDPIKLECTIWMHYVYSSALTSAVVLHVVLMSMIFQMVKVTNFPLPVNKINFDHLIYEPQNIQKVFKHIKLKHLRLISGSNFYCVFSERVHSFNQIKCQNQTSYRIFGVFSGASLSLVSSPGSSVVLCGEHYQ